MIRRVVALTLLAAITALPTTSSGGTEWGDYGKPGLIGCMKKQICGAVQNLNGRFAIKSVRWVARDGGSTGRVVAVDLLNDPRLIAPTGRWVGVVLVLDGPVELRGALDGGERFDLSADLDELYVPLSAVANGGDSVRFALPADLAGLDDPGLVDLLHEQTWAHVSRF